MKTFSFIRTKRNILLELESTDRTHEEQALGEECPRIGGGAGRGRSSFWRP
jgi:hypothetical protein